MFIRAQQDDALVQAHKVADNVCLSHTVLF